jgi:acyl-CoA synthetase (AMP-forming)/AMP-acid ligase II
MFGLFHMAGWSSIETSWSSDRPIHLVTRAEPSELLGVVERHGASTLYCIPAVWQRILDEDTGHDTSGVVEALTGTSLVTLELIDAIKARFPGSWTSIAYGSTEIGRGATLLDPDLYDHPGSVGQPPPMVTATLSDDGELWLRGPTMFSGYLDRPDATAEAIDDDGWFHTGDLATRDVDGYFTITGRRSESIRSGGEWVAPIEVETAVRSHPAVDEVAVVGLPDDRWGELVCAAIVVRQGAQLPTVDELRAHLAGALIGAKQPRIVVQVDGLPRTDATGQIRRRKLRDQIVAERSA